MIFTLTLNPALDKQYLVEHLEIDEVLHAKAIQIDYGGKGFNVSRMLANLGEPSTALGFVGGSVGNLLREGLNSQGISEDLTIITEETRTNVTVVSEIDGHHIKVNEPGPRITTDEANKLLGQVGKHLSSGTWWVLAGSLARGLPVNFYQQLISLIHAEGANTVLDTSGQPLVSGLIAHPKLVKPNMSELAQLVHQRLNTLDDIIHNLEVLSALGAENVAVSAGKYGAIITNCRKAWVCTPPQIKEVNPVGAGDAMVAGLTKSLAHGDDLPSSLRWGTACGTAAAMTSGTQMPTRESVEAIYELVKVKEC